MTREHGQRAGGAESGVLQVPIAGVTLLAVLLLIAVMGLAMGQAAETWDRGEPVAPAKTILTRKSPESSCGSASNTNYAPTG